MKLAVLNKNGEKVRDITLSDAFLDEISPKALTLYVHYLNNAVREPIANVLDRSEVSGGGKKPWKQKGTGRARHGSSRSPLWVHGGVTFGPSSEQNFKQKLNKSLKRKAILSIFGSKAKAEKLIVVDSLALEAPKTKDAINLVSNVKAEGKISVVFGDQDTFGDKSFRNIEGIKLSMPKKLDVISIISSDSVVISESALKEVEETYNKVNRGAKAE
ncbi:MAG TPA: 50S ribosomal protein L4 [bacterium]|nr:50S ribosomal protein L4 [bacterium]